MGPFGLSNELMALLTVLEVLWIGISSVYIILERRPAHATIAWILAFAALPLLGFVVYLFLGPRRFDKRKRRRDRARQTVAKGARERDPVRAELCSGHLAPTISLIERAVGPAGALRVADVALLEDGVSKYAALLEAFHLARQTIHLEYYIWEPDRIGTRLRDVLVERARAGVAVRVLVDGLGSSGAGRSFWAPLVEAGGEVRSFNGGTLMTWRPSMTNFRTHRKIAIIDGRVGFTGGMNIVETQSSEFAGEAAWRDTHLRLEGEGVEGLARVFFEDWCYAGGSDDPIDNDPVEPSVTDPVCAKPIPDVPLQVVSSGPDENVDAIHKLFFTSITRAERRVELTTPYFVPDETILQALAVTAMRGVDVRLLVPASGDQPFVAAAARTYYPELIRAGVSIHELEVPVLHAKTLLVDDIAIVGTANMDNRSFRLNFEVVIAMYDARVAARLAEMFEADVAQARQVSLDDLRALGPWDRLYASTARLFSPML